MNEIIKVDFDKQTVSARELHKVLEATERFSVWSQRYILNFIEGEDYTSVSSLTEVQNNGGVQMRELRDYELSVDMAKHICLMSRTENGKKCRQYLIDLEKAWNTPEQIMSRALKIADQTIASLTSKVGELETAVQEMDGVIQNMAPKVDYADRILSSPDCMLVTQIAQDYGMSAKAFNAVLENAGIQRKVGGQWILYAAYQGKGYTKTRTNEYQRGDKVGTRLSTVWTQKGRMFLYTKLKDIGVIPKEEQENETT